MAGEKVSKIAASFSKSRKWLHTWIKRFKAKVDDTWYKDVSKAPIKTNTTLDANIEQQIVLIRQDLMNEKMAQVGAISIQYEFEKRSIKPIPNVWTINRIIKKHFLTSRSLTKTTSKDYPELFCHIHQMDLVGPRYIKGVSRPEIGLH